MESRAFRKDELEPMLRKLINNGVPREKQKAIKELISNELFHYIEPQHRQHLVEKLWDLGMAVKEQLYDEDFISEAEWCDCGKKD